MGWGRGEDAAGDIDVVLLEDGSGAAPPEPPDVPEPRARRRRRRAVLVVTAVLALVVGASAVQAWRERAAWEELAAVTGVVPRLDAAPSVAWSLPGVWVREVSESVLLVEGVAGLSTSAVDLTDGEVLWQPADDGGWAWRDCRFVRRTDVPPVLGLSRPVGDATEVVCTAVEQTEPEATTPDAFVTVVTVHDARTGDVLAERSLRGWALVDTAEGDVLHAEVDDDGRLEVVRWDPLRGADRWRQGTEVVATDQGLGGALWAFGDLLVVQAGEQVLWLSVEDGSVVPESAAADRRTVLAELVDGAVLEQVPPDAAGPGGLLVRERDGRARLVVEGWFAGPAVLDPRAPVLLAAGDDGALAAHDVRDGTLLWTRADGGPGQWAAGGMPLALVGHRLVLAVRSGLETVDARSGTALWATDLPVAPSGALTDGRSVLVAVPADDGSGTLIALDLRDGTEVWRVPLEAPADTLLVVADTLLVQGATGVTALRP